jgi:hypothetical protein
VSDSQVSRAEGVLTQAFEEFVLNIVLRYLATNARSVVHWVDTVGGFSAARASNVLSQFGLDVGVNHHGVDSTAHSYSE